MFFFRLVVSGVIAAKSYRKSAAIICVVAAPDIKDAVKTLIVILKWKDVLVHALSSNSQPYRKMNYVGKNCSFCFMKSLDSYWLVYDL